MIEKMKLTLIGATSRTGKELIRQSLEKEYEIVAYARRPEAVASHPAVSIVGGQLTDIGAMRQAMIGTNAVLVTLGLKLSTRKQKLMSFAVPNIIQAAQESGVKRVIVLSALGVGKTMKNMSSIQSIAARTILREPFKDHLEGESKLLESGLDWTTVHPSLLLDRPQTFDVKLFESNQIRKVPATGRTYRADVAKVMLDILEDEKTFGKQLIVYSK